ncbi:unnamed protein product [Macrosiphum euphorbiae]|uniref:Integrase catalytic domain-containing protein n=1 Tax=Macrosiphum euphorbiae TaxID=13131 RepID=A0AAV0W3X9_9HEMI|nr:unnamed protein product [Macrosiphum euphorbiae]
MADTNNTLDKLKETFVGFGFPTTIVSDNGTHFTSIEFSSFCQSNGIKHLTIALGHSASNGSVENTEKSFKLGLKKILMSNPTLSLRSAINKYLLNYRNSQHPTTGYAPAELIFGKKVNLMV